MERRESEKKKDHLDTGPIDAAEEGMLFDLIHSVHTQSLLAGAEEPDAE
jgi:hypothetical protein